MVGPSVEVTVVGLDDVDDDGGGGGDYIVPNDNGY